MKNCAAPAAGGTVTGRAGTRLALILPLVGLLGERLSAEVEQLVAACDPGASLVGSCASAMDPAISVAARRTSLLIAELRALAPSPEALSIDVLSYVAGVLWNGQIDRRPAPMRSTRSLPALRPAGCERFEYGRVLLAVLAPLRWLLPTDSQQLWEEDQQPEEECDLPPPFDRIRKEIERGLEHLAGTVCPMADDLGMSRPLLMQLDHFVQIRHYRWRPPRSRWRRDFFPVPIIASQERADEDDACPTVQMEARGIARREAKGVAHARAPGTVSHAAGG